MSDLNYVTSKLGNVTAKARETAKEVFLAAQSAGHDVWFIWGDGANPDHNANHNKGEPVLDFMVRNKTAGRWVRNYLWQHRARLGLKHVIWDHRITSTVNQPGVERWMEDRGDPTANHEDHVHSHQFSGSYTGPDGSGGTPVFNPDAQLVVDGELGPKTISKWQKIVGTPVDGVISEPYSEMVYWVQRYLKDRTDHTLVCDGHGIKQDGRPYRTVRALQRYLGTEADSVLDKPVSSCVKALQRRLNENRF